MAGAAGAAKRVRGRTEIPTVDWAGGRRVADERKFFERLREVVQDRIDDAERLGLQKLEEIERQGRREVERAVERHERRLEKLDKESAKHRKRSDRRRRKRRGRRDEADAWTTEPAPPMPPTPPTPPSGATPPMPPLPPEPPRSDDRRRGRRSRRRHSGHRSHSTSRSQSTSTPHSSGRSRSRRRSTPAAASPPTLEEKAYRRARNRANAKLAFYTHAAIYVGILMMLAVVVRSPRAMLIIAMSWGVGLLAQYIVSIAGPRLREQWIEKEVHERAPQNVTQERERTEGRHTQNLEDLSASIAHEIRNPIAAAKSLVQQMDEDPTAADNIEFASVALQELDRVERSISHLLRYAREEDLRFDSMEMADVVASAVETFRDRFERRAIDVQVQVDTRGAMRGDAEKLRRVVINLIGNAIDAFDEAATPGPVLLIMSGENLAGDEVWVRVRDNGPGIDDATRSKIWSPFYTTKASGTGLGLALSRKIVDAHGGSMELASTPGEGTEFVLTFPKNATPPERSHAI